MSQNLKWNLVSQEDMKSTDSNQNMTEDHSCINMSAEAVAMKEKT